MIDKQKPNFIPYYSDIEKTDLFQADKGNQQQFRETFKLCSDLKLRDCGCTDKNLYAD